MTKYPVHRQEAIYLREKEKLSLKEISEKLHISKSTAYLWTKEIPPPNLKHAERLKRGTVARSEQCRDARLDKQLEGRKQAKKRDMLHQAGCMLYWAEGWKNKNTLRFVNADENMLKLFCKFLTKSLKVPRKNIYLMVQYHDGIESEISDHWNSLLNFPVNNITKITPRGNSRKNRHPFGIVSITVRKSTEYCQHIFGAIQEYASFDNNYGLD
jgi:hypothetical protein